MAWHRGKRVGRARGQRGATRGQLPLSKHSFANERAFTRWVIDLARLYGWLVHHDRPAPYESGRGWATHMEGDAGFPDLLLLREGELIVAELKLNRRDLKTHQARWLERFQTVAETYLWTPEEFEAIVERLSRPRHPAQNGKQTRQEVNNGETEKRTNE